MIVPQLKDPSHFKLNQMHKKERFSMESKKQLSKLVLEDGSVDRTKVKEMYGGEQ